MPGRLVADKFGRYVDADAAALELLGLTLEELRALQIGDFSGPHAEMARSVWRRLAAAGQDMTSGESTLYLANGREVRVRYLRIAALSSGDYELLLEPIGAEGADLPPTSDRPASILREWRAAERDAEAAGSGGPGPMGAPADATDAADKLRRLYHDSVTARTKPGKDAS